MLRAIFALLLLAAISGSVKTQTICTTFNENCAVVKERVGRGDAYRFANDLQRALAKIGGGVPKMNAALFVKQWDFIASQAKKQGLPSVDIYAAAQPQIDVTPRGLRVYMFGVGGNQVVNSDMYHTFNMAAPTRQEPKPAIAKCDCRSQACANLIKLSNLKGTIIVQTGAFMLELDAPTCFKGDGDMEDPVNAGDFPNQVVMHMVPSRIEYSNLSAYVGKHVTVTGQPFGRDNAHHLTPVLLDPRLIRVD